MSRHIYVPEMDSLPPKYAPPKEMHTPGPDPHYHVNKLGLMEACYHRCRSMTTVGFWVGLTLGFPLEHLLWEKLWPFKLLTHWMGL